MRCWSCCSLPMRRAGRNFRRLGFARRSWLREARAGREGDPLSGRDPRLGAGLLVNGLLKKTRTGAPEQTVEFGGPWRFRPFENFDGDCRSNCSFASGEVSASAVDAGPGAARAAGFRVAAIGAGAALHGGDRAAAHVLRRPLPVGRALVRAFHLFIVLTPIAVSFAGPRAFSDPMESDLVYGFLLS